jgi:hypothetical protein
MLGVCSNLADMLGVRANLVDMLGVRANLMDMLVSAWILWNMLALARSLLEYARTRADPGDRRCSRGSWRYGAGPKLHTLHTLHTPPGQLLGRGGM